MRHPDGRATIDAVGARLSKAVVQAGAACANVSAMFVRAARERHEARLGPDPAALGDQAMKERFSAAYEHAFTAPLLDHGSHTRTLKKNFRPYSHAKLAAEYPCIILRINEKLDAATGIGLLELNPDHCEIEGIQVHAVGIACAKIEAALLRK